MAGASISGDFGRLAKLVEGLKVLADAKFRARTNKLMAAEVVDLVHQGFERGIDPNGRPWAPLKRRKGQILRDTNRLMGSIGTFASNATGFTVGTNVEYGAIHQFGGTINHAPHTELRAYSENRSGKRKRVDLYSKRNRVVRTTASYGSYATVIPARPFLPPGGQLSAKWTRALLDVIRQERVRALGA